MVAGELSTLDECVFGNEGFECFFGHKVIFSAVFFSSAGEASCVCGEITISYFCGRKRLGTAT